MATTNLTITVPAGSTNHGNSRLLCTPPQWYDFVIFYFANYVAHAATVVNVPGQHWLETLEISVFSLLVPILGVSRAVSIIARHPITERDPIKRAARSGALCMVGRDDRAFPDYNGDINGNWSWWNVSDSEPMVRTNIGLARRQVHGSYKFAGIKYCLVDVPRNAPVSSLKSGPSSHHLVLPTTHNVPKLLVSFIQAVWASITLYRARGDQIETFGYAAFGLTVAQYAFMSVANIVANILQPEYPSMIMIRTPLMDEAEREGCSFRGQIEVQLDHKITTTSLLQQYRWWRRAKRAASAICAMIPLAIIGALSGFDHGKSTSLERGFTMAWVVASIATGPYARQYLRDYRDIEERLFWDIVLLVVLGGPPIGGMVVVGRMIQRFGMCTLLG